MEDSEVLRLVYRTVKCSFRVIFVEIYVPLRKVYQGRVQARVNDSSFNFSIDGIELQIVFKVVHVNESNENLQEFYHDPIFEHFNDFSAEESSWRYVLL